MDTKMRIKLYEHKGDLISDRLVEQTTEFNLGPKEKHDGPISLELNLASKQDADNAILYIGKLIGNLPITTPLKKMKITKGTVELDDKEPIMELMNHAISRNTTQEALINMLRDHGFRFVDTTVITELVPSLVDNIKILPKHERYQWLIRLVKEAKDPKNDSYDHRLMFGIKIVGTRRNKVLVYMFGKFKKKALIPWDNAKKLNFKKVEKIMVFPPYMDYADRKKWRVENRKLNANPALIPTKFYTKNLPFVKLY